MSNLRNPNMGNWNGGPPNQDPTPAPYVYFGTPPSRHDPTAGFNVNTNDTSILPKSERVYLDKVMDIKRMHKQGKIKSLDLSLLAAKKEFHEARRDDPSYHERYGSTNVRFI
jgi:hypothetical protein